MTTGNHTHNRPLVDWCSYWQAVAAQAAKREAKLGRLPLWWWPCAAMALAIPFLTLALVILG